MARENDPVDVNMLLARSRHEATGPLFRGTSSSGLWECRLDCCNGNTSRAAVAAFGRPAALPGLFAESAGSGFRSVFKVPDRQPRNRMSWSETAPM